MSFPATRVLYVIQHHQISGAEVAQAPLLEADPDPLVACPASSPAQKFANRLGARTIDLPFLELRHSGGFLTTARSVPRGFRLALALRRAIRTHPERRVIFCTSLRPSLIGTLAAAGLGRRVVWCAPDFLPPAPLSWLIRLLARLGAVRVLSLSQAIADDLCGGSDRLRERTRVVHPGVDPGRFSPISGPARSSAAIVGHISPTKRTGDAITIAAMVAAAVPEFKLDVVGKAIFRDEDFELERALADRVAGDPLLARSVRFRGHRDDLPAALSETGMLLHCRDDEPFGIVMVEAMALGLPVIAPAAAGPLEIVEDGVTGILYPPGDLETAAAAVIGLCRDPDLALRMGAAARVRFERTLTTEANLEGTYRLLREATE